MTHTTHFCPDCGWEGNEPVCVVCGAATESLEVDPVTGKTTHGDTPTFDDDDDLKEDWEEEEDK